MDVLAAGRGSVEAFPRDPSMTYRISSIPCIQYCVHGTVYTVLCTSTERCHSAGAMWADRVQTHVTDIVRQNLSIGTRKHLPKYVGHMCLDRVDHCAGAW